MSPKHQVEATLLDYPKMHQRLIYYSSYLTNKPFQLPWSEKYAFNVLFGVEK
jgi:hypothetical protein